MHFITSVITFSIVFVVVPESRTCLDASVNPTVTAGRLLPKNPSANWRVRRTINLSAACPFPFCQVDGTHPFILTLRFTLQRIHQCP